jgi:hypothetical protein
MPQKQWPEKGTVNLEDIVKPLYDAMRLIYKTKRMRDGACYDGYGFEGTKLAAVCPEPNQQLSADGLDAASSQGRDAMTVVLGIAVQLGYIQGVRESLEKYGSPDAESNREGHKGGVTMKNPKPGEPLHVQAGMICVFQDFYVHVSRIASVGLHHEDGVLIDYGTHHHDNLAAVINCTIPEVLDAMERAQEKTGSRMSAFCHGFNYGTNHGAGADYDESASVLMFAAEAWKHHESREMTGKGNDA